MAILKICDMPHDEHEGYVLGEEVDFNSPNTGTRVGIILCGAHKAQWENAMEALGNVVNYSTPITVIKTTKTATASSNGKTANASDTGTRTRPASKSDVRDWLRDNGYQVNDKGRISDEHLALYNAAHPETSTGDSPNGEKADAVEPAG